jgi:hypothetical protein
MSTQIEDRLAESLERRAQVSDRLPSPVAEGWSRAKVLRRQRRRLRAITSTVAVVAMLATGFGVYALWDRRPVVRNVANQEFDPNFRLLPTWLPNELDVTRIVAAERMDSVAPPSQRRVRQWAKGSRSVTIQDGPAGSLWGDATLLPSRERSLASLEDCLGGCSVFWGENKNVFQVSASGDIGEVEFVQFVRSLTITKSEVVVGSNPFALPVVYEGGDAFPFGSGWHLRPIISLQVSFALWAQPVDTEYGRLNHPGQPWMSGKLTSVRGMPARLSSVRSGDEFVLNWHERGWNLSLTSDSEANVRRIAEGLRSATRSETAQLQRPNPNRVVPVVPRTEREAPTNDVVSIADGSVSIRMGETATTDGCVRTLIMEGLKKEELCIPMNDQPVIWSQVRVVNEKQILIVVGGPQADAFRIGGTAANAREPQPARELGAQPMEGHVVENADERGYTWIGVSMVELPDLSASTFELFSHVVEESPIIDDGSGNDAGSVSDDQIDGSFPEGAAPDFGSQMLMPIGQFSIPK